MFGLVPDNLRLFIPAQYLPPLQLPARVTAFVAPPLFFRLSTFRLPLNRLPFYRLLIETNPRQPHASCALCFGPGDNRRGTIQHRELRILPVFRVRDLLLGPDLPVR